MRIVSDNLKNALKQPTTQRKGRILVNDNYYEVYNVEYYADSYNEGNVIGNAIASQLDFDLPYMEKFDTFKYFDGVWTGSEYEYVDMGTFTVFDEKDEDEFNKHITAFDNLIKFNVPFIDKNDYPKTLFSELENICEQAGVELKNESIANGNFIIENNQFVNNESLKTILKAICQVSGNYAVIKDDILVLQLQNETDEVINNTQHEPMIWKRKTYGINQVVLGLSDVEGEYVLREDAEDIETNGVHKLVINDNPFAYTQEKRLGLINELFEQVKGFGYVPFDFSGEWLNYIEIGDRLVIDDVETIVLRIDGKSPNSLESVMSAPAIIDSAVTYANNTNNVLDQVRRAEMIVDKQNQTIETITQDFEVTEETIIKQVQTLQTTVDAQIKIIENIQSNINENGEPTSVTTTTGFTFNAEGLHIERSGEPTKSTVDEAGIEVQDANTGTNEVQFYAGYVNDDVVADERELEDYKGQSVTYTKNVIFKKYLATTNGRMENVHHDRYGDGIGFFV